MVHGLLTFLFAHLLFESLKGAEVAKGGLFDSGSLHFLFATVLLARSLGAGCLFALDCVFGDAAV